jgi:hypothetical protein
MLFIRAADKAQGPELHGAVECMLMAVLFLDCWICISAFSLGPIAASDAAQHLM